jgi:hypothetical protein
MTKAVSPMSLKTMLGRKFGLRSKITGERRNYVMRNFIFYTFCHVLFGRSKKGDGRTCRMNGTNEKCI